MTKLRDMARGQACTVRLPHCLGGGETAILAHIRRASIAGVGQKPPDLCAVYSCFSCHEILDGRRYLANLTKAEIDQYALFALLRTLVIVSKELKL